MSSPRYGWWGYAKHMARQYPALLAKLAAMQAQSITADYSGQAHGGGASRTTENAALRQLPRAEQEELDAVRLAVDQMVSMPGNGRLRLRIIDLVYWKRTHNLCGAAQAVHVSEATAKRYNGDFLRAVARARGLLD